MNQFDEDEKQTRRFYLHSGILFGIVLGALFILAIQLLTGCAGALPPDSMKKFAHMIEGTKAAHQLVCNPPASVPLQCRTPESDAVCEVAAVQINVGVDAYNTINDNFTEE